MREEASRMSLTRLHRRCPEAWLTHPRPLLRRLVDPSRRHRRRGPIQALAYGKQHIAYAKQHVAYGM
eukprot:3154605-Rhodomonas_salina.1